MQPIERFEVRGETQTISDRSSNVVACYLLIHNKHCRTIQHSEKSNDTTQRSAAIQHSEKRRFTQRHRCTCSFLFDAERTSIHMHMQADAKRSGSVAQDSTQSPLLSSFSVDLDSFSFCVKNRLVLLLAIGAAVLDVLIDVWQMLWVPFIAQGNPRCPA